MTKQISVCQCVIILITLALFNKTPTSFASVRVIFDIETVRAVVV